VPDSDENRRLVESQIDATGAPIDDRKRLFSFAQVIPPRGSTPPVDYGGSPSVSNRRVRMWPYAIRVTVRAFDQRNRLEQPIVRSIVHRFD
jgi:hypothetical protein